MATDGIESKEGRRWVVAEEREMDKTVGILGKGGYGLSVARR